MRDDPDEPMLIRRSTLDAIAAGRVTLAVRRCGRARHGRAFRQPPTG